MSSVFNELHRIEEPGVAFSWLEDPVPILEEPERVLHKGSLHISSPSDTQGTPRSYMCYLLPFKLFRVSFTAFPQVRDNICESLSLLNPLLESTNSSLSPPNPLTYPVLAYP